MMLIENHASNSTNDFFNIIFEGLKEIIGCEDCSEIQQDCFARDKKELLEIKDLSFEYLFNDELTNLQKSFVQRYRQRGAKGMAVQVGSAAFKYFLRKYGKDSGLTSLDYRITPAMKRYPIGLTKLAEIVKENTHYQVSVQEDDSSWLWIVNNGLYEKRGDADEFIRNYFFGMLQAYMTWASSGKIFSISDVTAEMDSPASCSLKILREPIEN